MFMFGIQCIRCNHEIIAPHGAELLDDKVIRHLWHCPSCNAQIRILSAISEGSEVRKRSNDECGCFSPVERNVRLGWPDNGSAWQQLSKQP